MPVNSKKKKIKASLPGNMKPETVEKIVAKELWRDERTHKILGAFFILMAFLFLLPLRLIYLPGRKINQKFCWAQKYYYQAMIRMLRI